MPSGTPTRILMLGHCSYVFIHPIARTLKSRGDYTISAINLNQPGSDLSNADLTPFDQLFPEPSLADLEVNIIVDQETGEIVVNDAAGAELARFNPKQYSDRYDLSDLNAVVAEDLTARKYAELMQGYDIYNLHYMDRRWISAFRYLPPDAKTVVSTWGSDLFREAGVEIYRRQLSALERADLITTTSLEMTEILVCKFGRHLQPKIRCAVFGINPKLDDQIGEQCEADGRASFCERHNLAPERLIVCVGYNASPGQQHLDVLAALARLPERDQRRLSIVIPLSYNGNPEYIHSLKERSRQFGLEITWIDSYLDSNEVAQLRTASDIFIQVQISDAFSASMRETMLAGNVVVTGAWLPYGSLRRRGVYFREVERVSELTADVADLLETYAEEKQRSAANPELIRRYYNMETAIQTWVDVYEELVSSESGRLLGAA